MIAEKAHKEWISLSYFQASQKAIKKNPIKSKREKRLKKTGSSKSIRSSKSVSINGGELKKPVLSELFDGVFFFGDLNYRNDLPRLEVGILPRLLLTIYHFI